MDTIHILPQRPALRFMNTDSLIEFCRGTYDLPLSRVIIYRAQSAGKLHPLKHGGRLLFSVAEVQKWIEGESTEGQL